MEAGEARQMVGHVLVDGGTGSAQLCMVKMLSFSRDSSGETCVTCRQESCSSSAGDRGG